MSSEELVNATINDAPKSTPHVSKFPKKTKGNGMTNPKYVDVLEVDKPLASQAYGCFSFISPEKILKDKQLFMFENFLKQWELSKAINKFENFLSFISYKYKLDSGEIMDEFGDFIKEENDKIHAAGVEDDFKNFMDANETILENKFNKEHSFQTSVRALKSRGNFASEEEAKERGKFLRKTDPNFDIMVGPVGQWLVWDPEGYKTGGVEYAEEELNQLSHEKIKNETNAKQAFDNRVKESKIQAIQDNEKKAELTNTVLTQTIDKDGNLINKKLNTGDAVESKPESSSSNIQHQTSNSLTR